MSSGINPLHVEYGLAAGCSLLLMVYLVASIWTQFDDWSQKNRTNKQFVLGMMKSLFIFSLFIVFFLSTKRL